MANQLLNDVLDSYSARRLRNEQALEQRTAEVYSKVPRIKEIDDELRGSAFKVIMGLRSGSLSPEALKAKLKAEGQALEQEKSRLLAANSFSADYLQLQYDCPLCKDTGYANGQMCSCLHHALIEAGYKGSGLQESLEEKNFKNFNLSLFSDSPFASEKLSPRENMKLNHDQVMDFVWHFEPGNGTNLFFYGTTGTGKTYLCSCLAKETMDHGYSVFYTSAYHLCNLMDMHRFHRDDMAADELSQYNSLESVDLLIVDDLGTESATGPILADLYNCLNERLLRRLSTVISTNLTLGQIAKNYTDRLASRICGDYQLLKFYGPDLRLNK